MTTDSGRASAILADVDNADLALTTGSAQSALELATAVLANNDLSEMPLVQRRALHTRARALIQTSGLPAAITDLERAAKISPRDHDWLRILTSLCHSLMSNGDLPNAINVGEGGLRDIEGSELEHSVEAVRLVLTLAGAHAEHGDVDHAARMCRRTIETAEGLGSPLALASAYWNTSITEQMRGNFSTACDLARRALDLMEQTDDSHGIGSLRTQLGAILLADSTAAQPEEALRQLRRAAAEMEFAGAPLTDVNFNSLSQGRAYFLLGDLEQGRELAKRAHSESIGVVPLIEAKSLALLGEMAAHEGDVTAACGHYQRAAMVLSGIGADRTAAQMWFDLGGLLDQIGEARLALNAYRSASVASGVTIRRSGPSRGSLTESALWSIASPDVS